MRAKILILFGALLVLGAGAQDQDDRTVRVELFVMSQCPFAAQVEAALFPLVAEFGGQVAFSLEFVGDVQEGVLTSLHGESEVKGDKLQICASRYEPVGALAMVLCMSANMRAIPDNVTSGAAELGLDAEAIGRCAAGEEGRVLLGRSFRLAEERGVRGSPTVTIDGAEYQGPRGELAFRRVLCRSLGQAAPALCAKLPEPVEVPIVILTDKRCQDCPPPDRLEQALRGLFPACRVQTLDYGSAEGKRLHAALGGVLLPAVAFGREVERDDNYDRVRPGLRPAGQHLLLETGSRFDPTKEICENGVDDTADGKIDCQDPDCGAALVCRTEQPGALAIFIMSQCPYAVSALRSMQAVLERLGPDLRFSVHYIATAQGDSFRCLHGQGEAEENIRGLCVMQQTPAAQKFLPYFWCRGQDIQSPEWQACAKQGGIDGARLQACAEGGQGAQLLRQDLPLADELGIRGSPTWLANNRYLFQGIEAADILENFCRYNPKHRGCHEEKTR